MKRYLRKSWYTIDQLITMYQDENPHWSYDKCKDMAYKIKRELNTLNRNEQRSNKRFYDNNVTSYDDYIDQVYFDDDE